MYFVYKIKNNLNNKLYIGYSKNPYERFDTHIKDALKNRDNRPFYNAIRKYGPKNFSIKILGNYSTPNQAKINEIKNIKKFHTYFTGYNATKGGDGNNGIRMSIESNKKRSIALKGIKKNYNRMLGKKHSSKTKFKISQAHQGMKKPWVKWTKEQIIKRAMTRRKINFQQFKTIKLLKTKGLTYPQISNKLNLSIDMCKKWNHINTWSLY